jgi:8-oxo-dGTP diphosphatase
MDSLSFFRTDKQRIGTPGTIQKRPSAYSGSPWSPYDGWVGDAVTTAADRHDVVGALLIRAGQVLLCHRSSERLWYPNAWDIPGGHIEAGETPTAALVRELREEVGVIVAEPPGPEYQRLRADDFDLRVWVVSEWIGDPSNTSPDEHDDIGWFSSAEISGVPLAHATFLALIEGALGSSEFDG